MKGLVTDADYTAESSLVNTKKKITSAVENIVTATYFIVLG